MVNTFRPGAMLHKVRSLQVPRLPLSEVLKRANQEIFMDQKRLLQRIKALSPSFTRAELCLSRLKQDVKKAFKEQSNARAEIQEVGTCKATTMPETTLFFVSTGARQCPGRGRGRRLERTAS